ncbi:acyltransferase [Chitinophagaceae bacterium 26-R-25]|nr:acyltransferase [Chitinophagaceae bacterium 26-R-25]
METKYFKQLDGFRFLSIVAVMLAHFADFEVIYRIPFGFGVMFFFVLSSFLITRILLTSKNINETTGGDNFFSIKQFYIRRFLRIFPIYYLLIFAAFIMNWYPCRAIIVSLLTYTTNFKIASGVGAGDFTHLWSLAVEEQFYIFFPFLVFFLNSKNVLKIAIAFIVLGLVGRASLYLYNSHYAAFSSFNTISCLDSLGIGSLLAYLSLYKVDFLKNVIGNKKLFAGSIVVFLSFMIFSYSIFPSAGRTNFTSVVFMRFFFNVMSFWILGWAALFGYTGAMKLFLENRVVIYLGRISYGMYLYHFFVPKFLHMLFSLLKINTDILPSGTWTSSIGGILLYVTVTIIVSSISWYVIEKPMNGLKKYFDYNKKVVSNYSEKTINI